MSLSHLRQLHRKVWSYSVSLFLLMSIRSKLRSMFIIYRYVYDIVMVYVCIYKYILLQYLLFTYRHAELYIYNVVVVICSMCFFTTLAYGCQITQTYNTMMKRSCNTTSIRKHGYQTISQHCCGGSCLIYYSE